MENVFEIVGAVTMILTGLYTLSLIIPGDQPDKTLEKILDFTKRFSRK
jgi:hypothetical protein